MFAVYPFSVIVILENICFLYSVAIVVTSYVFYPLYFQVMGKNVLKAIGHLIKHESSEILKQLLHFREHVLATFFVGRQMVLTACVSQLLFKVHGKNM